MATLDGKKIKDTYKSLLKVGDNGVLDTDLQEVTDGEGNSTGLSVNNQGDLDVSGALTTGSVAVSGATSNDFIKGDGSLDSNQYATAQDLTDLSSNVATDIFALDTDLQAEAATRAAADDAITTALNTEIDNLNTLTVRVNDNENDINVLNTAVANNVGAISAETTARISADNALDQSIDTEAATRQSADTSLGNQITSEASARLSGDNTLQSNITTEQSARIAADSLLQTSINTEATNRTAADTALQSQITSNDSDIATLGTSKVPYTGATGDVNLGLNGLLAQSIQITGGTGTEGTFTWNADENTVDLIQNGVSLQLGQEVHINIRNNSGATIANGSPVYVNGTLGASGRLLVGLMIADGSIDPKYFIGVATEEILDGADGKATWFGKVRGIDTTIYGEGQTLYVSETVAGEWQTTEPTAPNPTIEAAFTINSKNAGTLFVRGDIGGSLHYLNDVMITSPQNEDALIYDSALGVWRNDGTVYQKIQTLEENVSTGDDNLDAEIAARIAGDNNLQTSVNANGADIVDLQTDKENKSEKGVANGYAPLDAGAKINEAYLPDSIVGQVSYQGTWDASTNTPALADPTTVKGHYYVVSTEGTYLGVTYHVGDWAISNGTIWEHIHNTDLVTTVFGRLGDIVANESDYSAYYPLISDLNDEISARTSGDATLQTQIDGILSNDIPATLAKVNQNEADIADLQPRVTANEGNISTNTGNISTNTSNIAANTFAINSAQGDITDLEANKQDNLTAGTGIDLTGNTVTNTAPDQTVVITGSGSTTVTGTYPTFNVESVGTEYVGGTGIDVTGATITNTAPDQTVTISGTGSTTVTGSYPNFSISSTGTEYTAGTGLALVGTEFQNTAPDQTVSISGGQGVSVSGTYPSFSIDSVAGSQIIRDIFSGTGSQTDFTLSGTPVNENYTQVFFDGVYQEKSGYTVAGTTLSFSEAPAAGIDVEVISTTTITILGEVSSVNGQIGAVLLDSDDVSEGSTNKYLLDDSVTYDKVANEFKGLSTLTAGATVDMDFNAAQVFNLTPNQNTTINVTNPKVGLTKVLVLTGGGATSTVGFTVGGSAGTFNLVGGEYDDTAGVKNFVQLICVNATEFWYSISQIA